MWHRKAKYRSNSKLSNGDPKVLFPYAQNIDGGLLSYLSVNLQRSAKGAIYIYRNVLQGAENFMIHEKVINTIFLTF